MTYRELIYSAVQNAMRGQPPNLSPAVDAENIAETLFASVSQEVSKLAAANPAMRALLRRAKTVTLTAGEGTLPSDVLIDFFADSTLQNTSNLNQKYAYRDYPDFIRRNDLRLGYYSRNGQTLMVRDPNQAFTVPLSATGSRQLVVPCQVERPADADDDIVGPEQVLSDIVDSLSDALRGQLIREAAGANA